MRTNLFISSGLKPKLAPRNYAIILLNYTWFLSNRNIYIYIFRMKSNIMAAT